MSLHIIASILIALAVLTGLAIFSQSLAKKREQRRRLLSALLNREREFNYILQGFPADFLPRDLNVLVHQCLIRVCEQLAKLEPQQPQHLQRLTAYSQQVEKVKQRPAQFRYKPLRNPAKLRELREQLNTLYKFLLKLKTRRQISQAELEKQQSLIKDMNTHMQLDGYQTLAQQALSQDKPKVAEHNLKLAQQLLARNKRSEHFQTQAKHIEQQLNELAAHAPAAETAPAAQATPADSEWEKFQEDAESWKKKRIYD